MNDNNFMNNNQAASPYKATRNLNTEIENPEININSATGINIQESNSDNISSNNYFNSQLNNNFNQIEDNKTVSEDSIENYINTKESNTFITNENVVTPNNTNYNEQYSEMYDNNITSTNKVNNYQPTLKEKKKPKSFKIPSELKVMLLIVGILLLFMTVMPKIFDFISEIELKLTR